MASKEGRGAATASAHSDSLVYVSAQRQATVHSGSAAGSAVTLLPSGRRKDTGTFYTPDFIVKTGDGTVWIVETKGREELDLPQKMNRLRQWCEDATSASQAEGGPAYRFVYVDQPGFERNPPKDFKGLVAAFREFQQ